MYYSVMVKSYKQHCPVAKTLDIVGEKWTLLILRDFFLHGARRFQDLQDSLTGIAPNTLSARLKQLEQQGVLERKSYSDSPPRFEYVLTEKGNDLGAVVKALYNWGDRYT
ncbi:MAG: helix-turn-helix domain-containing protein [Methylococcales bacterium]